MAEDFYGPELIKRAAFSILAFLGMFETVHAQTPLQGG